MGFISKKDSSSAGIQSLTVSAALVFFIFGCATHSLPPEQKPLYPKPYKVNGKWYQPLPDSKGFRQRGLASWYGEDFHGKKTSSGEIYDMHAMTAAHKILPLGTYVRVRNLENNSKVDVRVNDRGPFVRGRIIDLSYSAAKQIGLVNPGTARVEVMALGTPETTGSGSARTYVPGDYYYGNFTFQVGAFVNRENAERQKTELAKNYKNVHISVYDRGDKIFYRVRVGKFLSLDEAGEHEDMLIRDGFADAFMVAE